jgi:hypothetical protein
MWIHKTFWLSLRNGKVDSVSATEPGAKEPGENALRCDLSDEWIFGTLRPMLLLDALLEHRWDSTENCCSCGVRLEIDPRFTAYDMWLGHVLAIRPDPRSTRVAKWFWQARQAMHPLSSREKEILQECALRSLEDVASEHISAGEPPV